MNSNVTGSINNLVDGIYAKDYYNIAELTIGAHLVNPTNGRRFSDNKIFGKKKIYVIAARLWSYNYNTSVFYYGDALCYNQKSICSPNTIYSHNHFYHNGVRYEEVSTSWSEWKVGSPLGKGWTMDWID